MVRDTEEGKIDYSLVLDGPMFKRWAAHLTKGAQKYAPRNWMKATGEPEFDRFKRSFLRHAIAYLDGERDEDHAAAIIFNVNGMEYVREQQLEHATFTDFTALIDSAYCGNFGPNEWYCERPPGHSGDHAFDWEQSVDEGATESEGSWPQLPA